MSKATIRKPDSGPCFLATAKHNRLEFPFNRFFINELQAQDAERLLRRSGAQGAGTYALVRVGSGRAVLEDIYVNGKRLRQALADDRDGRAS